MRREEEQDTGQVTTHKRQVRIQRFLIGSSYAAAGCIDQYNINITYLRYGYGYGLCSSSSVYEEYRQRQIRTCPIFPPTFLHDKCHDLKYLYYFTIVFTLYSLVLVFSLWSLLFSRVQSLSTIYCTSAQAFANIKYYRLD